MIREANASDAPTVVRFLRLMLEEMASMGGHDVRKDDEEWLGIEAKIGEAIGESEHVYLLAELAGAQVMPVGLAEARAIAPGAVFEPKLILHIHAVYVLEPHRRKGVGRALLTALMEWGQKQGCVEAELDTLVGNPARTLYEALGFSVSELKMTRKL